MTLADAEPVEGKGFCGMKGHDVFLGFYSELC